VDDLLSKGAPVSIVKRSADFAADVAFICVFHPTAPKFTLRLAWGNCRTSSCPHPSVGATTKVTCRECIFERRRLFRNLQHEKNDARANPASF